MSPRSVTNALITLQDIDNILDDLDNPTYRALGLPIIAQRLEELRKVREEVRADVPERTLQRYDRLRQKFGRGIAPVLKGVCLNCFGQMPTANSTGEQDALSCPSCGVLVYKG